MATAPAPNSVAALNRGLLFHFSSSSPQPGLIIKSEGVRNVESIHDSQPASLAVTVAAAQASDSATHAHLSTTTTTTVAQSTSCTTVSLAQENGNLGKRVRKSTSKFEEYEQSIVSGLGKRWLVVVEDTSAIHCCVLGTHARAYTEITKRTSRAREAYNQPAHVSEN